MKQRSILALMVAALMISPAVAEAARGDGSYKPAQERAGKKGKKAGQKGKKAGKANKAPKATKAKRRTKAQQKKKVARHPVKPLVIQNHKRKKKKSRKFKRFLKKSLRAFENYGYLLKQQQHRAHHNHYGRRNWAPVCVPKHVMRARLVHRGWHDFELLGRGPNRIRLEATNFKGRRFRIVLDRCNGHIIKKRPLRRYWSRY